MTEQKTTLETTTQLSTTDSPCLPKDGGNVYFQDPKQPHMSYVFTPEQLSQINCTSKDSLNTILTRLHDMREKNLARRANSVAGMINRVMCGLIMDERLDLSSCKINDEAAGDLADALKENDYIKIVDLNNNAIGDKGAEKLAELMLNELNLSNNKIGPIGCEALSQSTVTRLILTGNPIGPEGASFFGESQTINELLLEECGIGNTGAKKVMGNKLFAMLCLDKNGIDDNGIVKNVPADSNLVIITLGQNGISDKGAAILAKHKKLKILDLSSNKITDDAINKCFVKNKTIRVLILNNNSITGDGFSNLLKNKTIEKLFLRNNNISFDKDSVILKNETLVQLHLSNNKLDESCEQVYQTMLEMKKLVKLDLSQNEISNEFMEMLTKKYGKNK